MSLSQVEKEIEKLQKELLDCNQERKKEIESQIKKQEEYYPCQEALEMWIAYKKEKRQTYKPRGLEALKKKLLQLSNGNPEYAKEIVEYSMGNNYTGLFSPKINYANSYEQQQRTFNKISSILAD